nr:phosphotransferase [Priestia megaterium]
MTSYIVKGDEGTYVYRVYRHQWRDKPTIQFELDVLQHLYSSRFKLSKPMLNKDDTLLRGFTK